MKTSGWSNDEYLAGIFAVADFPRPAAGTNGNLPRNAYRGPGFSEVSLSLAKKFVAWRLVQRGGPPRRVQRVQHDEPGRPGDGPEQRQLRQVDDATGDAGDAARPPPPVLIKGARATV